ncbi:MAG: hypothetical protein MUC29_08245 [Pyrinomonadaceae bacterium]|jgi:hypothetical protein|nr:hypothetical protein [Pyrinomonadaceae bacterium]
MRKDKKTEFDDSPVFGSLFYWDLPRKISIILFAFILFSEIYTLSPKNSRNIMAGFFMVIYLTLIPLVVIWFAEFIDFILGEFTWLKLFKISPETPLKIIAWISLIIISFVQIGKFFSENYY